MAVGGVEKFSLWGLGPSAMAALFSYENFGMSIKQAEYCMHLA